MSGADFVVAAAQWAWANAEALFVASHVLLALAALVVLPLSVVMGGAKLIAALWVWKQALTYLKQRGVRGSK